LILSLAKSKFLSLYGSLVFQTGQKTCFYETGNRIDCHDTGQDGDFQAGMVHHDPRFTMDGDCVHDNSTGLTWLKKAHINPKPLDWKSAFDLVSQMNKDCAFGYDDWRVPDIVELEGITDMDCHSPALPPDHGFAGVQDFYWSATTSMVDTDYAWVLYTVDGAVGVGYKPLSEFYLWPVR
jgi:hypothetical protein